MSATSLHDDRKKEGNSSGGRIELSQITVTIDSIDNVKRTALTLDRMLGQYHPHAYLQYRRPGQAPAPSPGHRAHVQCGPRLDRQYLAFGGWDWNYEHHAGDGLGADPRDRHPPRLGARRRDIIEQFLIEATVISSSGGLIGVLVGVAVPPLYSHLSGIPVVIRPWSPIIAFLIAVAIGVVFGVYPAYRAAMLDPVDALRWE